MGSEMCIRDRHKWIPLVVIVVLALVLILIQYFMIDILMAVNTK